MGCALSSADLSGDGLRIKVIKEIAKGGFSQVLRCEDMDSGDAYAVKKIIVNSDEEEIRVHEEVEVHRLLNGVENAVQLLGIISGDSTFHLVFPYYDRGNLADELGRRRENSEWLDQLQVLTYFVEVCSVVEFLHAKSIAHRDLKTANILIGDDGRGLLTDFGSCGRVPRLVENSRQHQEYLDEAAELCSMPYRAPELFTCEVGSMITDRVDIWSLGCCLYALCFFVSPFDLTYEKGNSIALAVQSPQMIPYPKEAPYNEEVMDLIKWMLAVESEQRPSAREVMIRSRELQMRLQNVKASESSEIFREGTLLNHGIIEELFVGCETAVDQDSLADKLHAVDINTPLLRAKFPYKRSSIRRRRVSPETRMLSKVAVLLSVVAAVSACAAPNGTDKAMHWWQCNAGPITFYNATPFDSTGTKYEYPIHLSQPIIVKADILNPTHVYTKPDLRNTVNLWSLSSVGSCHWSSLPTLGLLKDLSACDQGVPCPVETGRQTLPVQIDFTQFQAIINLLKDNQPYQLEYLLHDRKTGDDACLMVQAWAYLK
ncbi:unnamed protein product [Caenorhabditis auriculariae]|uniref:non-specific serine/threonine protein kinase n=1 Tax=Caenorhabditis auriculariae TaxID=2777116 RepID=A0A8S1GWV8_9PELO|nr:unnamed protein product [Caenorhabditis auriculariae]